MEQRFRICKTASELGRRGAASDGMTLIELLVAVLVLVIGILSTFTVFDTSKGATHVSERLEGQNHVAQREVERIESLPYSQVGLSGPPGTSTNSSNPDYYVSGLTTCPNFTWNQSAGAANATDSLIVNGCTYNGQAYTAGAVSPVDTTTYPGYTVYDFITWVNDGLCGPAGGCVISDSYKRVTVEVTSSGPVRLAPTVPVMVSGIVADPHAAPQIQQLNTSTPLVTCSPLVPSSTPCNYGLNGATANVFYLTDSSEPGGVQTTGATNSGSTTVSVASTTGVTAGLYISGAGIPTGTTVSSVSSGQIVISQAAAATASGVALAIGPYSPRTSDNSCMHYTEQQRPLNVDGTLNCGASTSAFTCSTTSSSTIAACPRPDLLSPAPAPPSVTQEYNFSPSPPSPTGMAPPGGQGRVIKRDPNPLAISCAVPPSSNATSGEFWATVPLSQALTLNGSGGMTLYTSTLTGVAANVTLCVGFYLETPVSTSTGTILDPLNLLCGLCTTPDSTLLGAVSYKPGPWPATVTPVSFPFQYMSTARAVSAGTSLGVRVWLTSTSGDDVVVQYDAPSLASGVEIDSQ